MRRLSNLAVHAMSLTVLLITLYVSNKSVLYTKGE